MSEQASFWILNSCVGVVAMVAIELHREHEKRLSELAAESGLAPSAIAGRIVEDFLDLQSVSEKTDDEWAQASVALAPEFMDIP